MSIVDLYESSKHRNNVAHFSAIVNLAIIDGDLNEDEEKLVNRFARKLDITEAEYKEIVENSKKYPVVPQAKTDDRLERLLDLFKIIYSDHEIDEAELKLILRYAIQLGFSQERAEEIIYKTTKVFSGKIDLDQYKSILSIL
ncbi:MAG: TerB family tellurite resistance protein [Tenacibaculum sp.]|uniref:tellurite resistance TerB family protein n=1 Tax=Tenacibaculum sp. TaxID=1906242 RepID=UPI0017F8A915|nr:TerB family tellurite resistance protein [Tenacibaculum sp.]NVK08045.1 TerB family tellurite resistance protein [Tenacibaculum sp.]